MNYFKLFSIVTSLRTLKPLDIFSISNVLDTFIDFKDSYPNVRDSETVLTFGRMAQIAYDDLDKQIGFGWENDGLRGYIFMQVNFTDIPKIVIAIKGTSARFFGIGESSTFKNDKFNDNLMFSCCCGKVDRSWWGVCGCSFQNATCNSTCLLKFTNSGSDTYYNQAQSIYNYVKSVYPHSDIYMTGHSLGGALAALIAYTNGIPAITFNSPGSRLFAQRIGLLHDSDIVSDLPIWNFGNSGDPIYLGECRGVTSICYMAGYAMESKCHLGKTCTYMTNSSKSIMNHRIKYMVDNVLENLSLPECKSQDDCQDCIEWNFV